MYLFDNRTILYIQIIMGVIITLFSLIPAKSVTAEKRGYLKAGNICYLISFSLLSLQGVLPTFYTIIIANSGILLFFICFNLIISHLYNTSLNITLIKILVVIHTILFLFFLYIKPSTVIRIIVVSIFIVFIIIYTILKIIKNIKNLKKIKLILIPQIFYILVLIFRISFTITTHMDIKSIFNVDFATSIIFISTIIYHLALNISIYSILLSSSEEDLKNKLELIKSVYKDIKDLNNIFKDSVRFTLEALLYDRIITIIQNRFNVKSIIIYRKDKNLLKMVSFSNINDWFLEKVNKIPINMDTMTGRSVIENRPQTFDIESYPNNHLKEKLINEGYVKFVSYPIRSYKGIYGSISLGLKQYNNILDEDIKLFLLICNHVGSILENAAMYKELDKLAAIDPLTGISNKRSFDTEFKRSIDNFKRHKRLFSILMLDIDYFKKVNDDYGHEAGDFVLKETVRLIESCLRTTDIFARYGGEEFVIILDENNAELAYNTAERVRKKIEMNLFRFEKHKLKLTISIGIAEIDNNSIDSILNTADEALYKAKAKGRNRTIISKSQF